MSDLFVVMGVSGSGKTTVARALANALNLKFIEGDDFHPKENVLKMQSGKPLDDGDRYTWLIALNKELLLHKHTGAVLSCSALKDAYRRILSKDLEKIVHWVFLKGEYQLILNRMKARKDHFMPSELLKSQFDILEIPKKAIEVDIKNPPNTIISKILQEIKKGT